MDPQFKNDESLAAGTQRILEMQLVSALEHLKAPPEQRDAGIHECRKCLKYARALLRLVAGGMPGAAFRKWNRTLRDAARCISDLRDTKAVLECLDALAAEQGGDACPMSAPFAVCREVLVRLPEPAPQPGKPATAEAAAEKAFLLISGLLTTPHDPELGRGREARLLRDGLKRSYALGRRAQSRMRKTGDIESAHEWRKRAKDLRYQVDMLQPVWPGMCGAIEDELHRLTDYLGRIHDLHLLEAALSRLAPGTVPDDARAAVQTAAARAAAVSAEEALRLGARLYGGKPGLFAGAMAGWWKRWRGERAGSTCAAETTRDEGKQHE